MKTSTPWRWSCCRQFSRRRRYSSVVCDARIGGSNAMRALLDAASSSNAQAWRPHRCFAGWSRAHARSHGNVERKRSLALRGRPAARQRAHRVSENRHALQAPRQLAAGRRKRRAGERAHAWRRIPSAVLRAARTNNSTQSRLTPKPLRYQSRLTPKPYGPNRSPNRLCTRASCSSSRRCRKTSARRRAR